MERLNIYVEALRKAHGMVPFFDPFDGGDQARLLLLLETPGPSAAAIRFTSRDNPSGTARNIQKFLGKAAIDRSETAIWNAIPWVIARNGNRLGVATRAEEAAASRELPRLLCNFPKLQIVVLAGRAAARMERAVRATHAHLKVVVMPHPSPTYVNTSSVVACRIQTVLEFAAKEICNDRMERDDVDHTLPV